jgi:hypothetical protein
LDVNGNANFTNGFYTNTDASSTSYFVGANGTRPIIFQNNTGASYDFGFKFTDSNTFTIVGGNTLANPTTDLVSFKYDGNVGIGTTNPSYKLDVSGSVNIVGDGNVITPDLYFNGAGGFGGSSGQVRAYAPNNSTLSWYWDNTQFTFNNYPARMVDGSANIRFYFDNNNTGSFYFLSGSVGIGTTSPVATLHVVGNISGSSYTSSISNAIGFLGTSSYATTSSFATSETLGTVTGRGASTGTQITVATAAGGSMYIGRKAGSGYADTVTGATFKSITDNPNGASYAFASYYSGSSGYNSFFVSALGDGYFSGSVGIGTTAPSAKLTIVENTNGGTINLVGRTSDDTAAINFRATGDASTYAYISPDTNEFRMYHNDGFMSFYPGGTEKVRITSGGNVGIGTSSPGAKLDVRGQVLVNNVTASVAKNQLTININGTNYAQFYDLGTIANTLVLGGSPSITTLPTASISASIMSWGLTSGNVGIGLTSPSYNLSISGSVGLQGNEEYLYFHSNYSVGNNARGKIRVVGAGGGSGYGGDLRFSTRKPTNVWNEDALTIDSSGNVGIGTTSPTSKLHITQTSAANALLLDSDSTSIYSTLEWKVNGGNLLAQAFSDSSDASLYVRTVSSGSLKFGTNATERMRIASDGNVGIGSSSPGALLEVSSSTASSLLNVKGAGGNGLLYVSSSGNVGIGTSNPIYKLEVSGSFGATTKSFIIDHPTKQGKKLIYGSLESPYHGIRLTGRDTIKDGKCKVNLPDYIYKLIRAESVNIHLTGIKCGKTLYIDDINIPENYFTIAYDKAFFESYKDYDFFWDFTAIRSDVPELITEV